MTFKDRYHDLQEIVRELTKIRTHNLKFKDGNPQDDLFLFAEASLCLLALERFLRILPSLAATDIDTLRTLLERATSRDAGLLNFVDITSEQVVRDEARRQRIIGEIADMRNTLQHGNYEQAAKQAGLGSPNQYFKTQFASEIENLYQIVDRLFAQIDPDTGARRPLTDLSAWHRYVTSPDTLTFQTLVAAVTTGRYEAELSPSLAALYAQTKNWRVAQHAALLFNQEGQATIAMYFAHCAVVGSAGDPMARLALARVYWTRRQPLAVLFQTKIIRAQARRVHVRARRKLLQHEVAELNARAYAYIGDASVARVWLKVLVQDGEPSIETLLQFLVCNSPTENADLFEFAGINLANRADLFSGRVQGKIRIAARLAFLRCLRAKNGY